MVEFTHTKRIARKGQRRPVTNADIEKRNAENGIFDYDVINGLTLTKMEYKTPPKGVREARRSEFSQTARPAFLKYIAENCRDELLALGVKPAQIEQMKQGRGVNGFNVHHKLPIHGGGKNDFSNFIFMPIPPHDELHHNVIDPQIKNKDTTSGITVLVPWTDKMVWEKPAQARQKLNAKQNDAAIAAAVLKKAQSR